MNKDINYTLAALVPLLRMNGEKVVSVEAVEDWYEIDGREYMKEVAEITYENGYRQYADIGCDANLTAVYDVIRVIQQMKPKSEKIERIVRDVYPNPEVPDTNVGTKLGTNLAEVGTDCISRQAAIDALDKRFDNVPMGQTAEILKLRKDLRELPSIQSKQKRGKWIYGEDEYGIDGYHCDKCGFFVPWDYTHKFINYIEDYNFCPSCGADMRGEQDGRDD